MHLFSPLQALILQEMHVFIIGEPNYLVVGPVWIIWTVHDVKERLLHYNVCKQKYKIEVNSVD